jgi:hypothetical protein
MRIKKLLYYNYMSDMRTPKLYKNTVQYIYFSEILNLQATIHIQNEVQPVFI